MSRSNIFDEYAKIASEKGLVNLAEDSPKLKKYKKSPYPRVGSDDISVIEALYGVPRSEKDSVKYEKNIMEAAHPKPVVIAPSYDKLNGLVENNIERQNITLNIVMKPTTGKNVTQGPKYAKKELLMQLVRIANDLDNQNIDDLRVIADDCIEELKKKANWEDWLKEKGQDLLEVGKGAGTGALIGGVAGGVLGAIFGEGVGAIPGAKAGALAGAALGGVISSLTKTGPQVRNVQENAQDLINQLEDIKEKIPSSNPEYIYIDRFQKHLQALAYLSNQYNALISDIQNKHQGSSSEDANQAAQLTKQFMSAVATITQDIANWNDKLSRHVFESYVHHSKALDPVYQFMDDDIEDVSKSIKSLQVAIQDLERTFGIIKQDVAEQVSNPQVVPASNEEKYNETPYRNEEPAFNNMDYLQIAKMLGRGLTDKDKEFFDFLSKQE